MDSEKRRWNTIAKFDEGGSVNLKQLETFLQIVEAGSFAAAATVLHTTQSTVSARIKDLEHHLGVDLFDRSAHRAKLTPKGRELLDLSRQLITLMDSVRERIGTGAALAGTVRLGAVGLVAGTWLPKVVMTMQDRHPQVNMRLEVALTQLLLDRTREGHLDLAIVAGPVEDEALDIEVLAEAEFAWMASPLLQVPGHVLGPSELGAWPLLSFPQESYHVPVIKRWFREAGATFKPSVICNSMEVIARLVAQGRGIGLLPREQMEPEIAAGRLQLLRTAPVLPGMELALIRPARRHAALASATFECIREVIGGNPAAALPSAAAAAPA